MTRSLAGRAPADRLIAPEIIFTPLDQAVTGIHFRHHNGGTGVKEMIETMGSGCALLDYDNDGYLDIYLVNGAAVPSLQKRDPQYFNRLFRNCGNFKFVDVTQRAKVQGLGYGMGAAVGDYDNDGNADIYVTNFGMNLLLRNCGNGTFQDVTAQGRVAGGGWSTSAAFLDYDRDGHLDLFVSRYVQYELGKGPYCGRAELGWRSYCLPEAFPPSPNILYRNNGNGTFTDVSQKAGISQVKGNGLGVAVGDLDGDEWTDIVVANDRTRNFFFHNKHDGTFEEIGMPAGLAFSNDGVARAGMGLDIGDFDQDGRVDIAMSNFESEGIALFRNQGSLLFHDEAGERGLLQASFPYVGFGIKFFDYDNDGTLDLFAANGHVLDDIAQYRRGMSYPQPKLLFRNAGGRFLSVRNGQERLLGGMGVGRGVAAGDLDNDGNIDLVVSNNNQAPDILKNEGTQHQNSVLLKLVGSRSNKDGIGTRIEIRCGREVRVMEATPAGSYLCSHDPRIHVGIGRYGQIDALTLRWPSGTVQRLRNLVAGRLHVISERDGIVPGKVLVRR